jgi:anti-anti-sigma factor
MPLADVQRAASRGKARFVQFNLSTSELWPGCLEIRIEGEVDGAVSGRVLSALDQAVVDGRDVLLDLAACEFIDAAALAVLVCSRRRLNDRGKQLLLYGVHGQVRRLLSITGLTENGLPIAMTKDRVRAGDRAAAVEPLTRSRPDAVGTLASV